MRQALREGWSVPDASKPRIVAELLQPFYAQDGLKDYKMLIALARTLLLLDREQWKRDHLEQADGNSGPMIVQVNIETVEPKVI